MKPFCNSKSRTSQLAALAYLTTLLAGVANASNNVGWALADQPNATTLYSPNPKYSFNSQQGSIEINGTGTGAYEVAFDNLFISGSPSDAQVTAYNSSNRCVRSGGTASGNEVTIGIECFDQTGHLANTAFTILFQTRNAPFGSANNGLAFVEQMSNDDFTSVNGYSSRAPAGDYGGEATINKPGAGNYTVTLGGLNGDRGNVQVTGSTSSEFNVPAQCKATGRGGASTDATVHVQCYRLDNGHPTFSVFSLAYAVGEPFGVVPGAGTLGVWALANSATSTNSYTPAMTFEYNGFATGHLTVQRTGTGLYTVSIPGTLSYSHSVALVTAFGPGNDYCNIASWATATVNVACYNQSGASADSQFEVTFQTAK